MGSKDTTKEEIGGRKEEGKKVDKTGRPRREQKGEERKRERKARMGDYQDANKEK